jgi:hypothetical protein
MIILEKYDDPSVAVTHALKLIFSYINDIQDKTSIAKKYTPNIFNRLKAPRKTKAIVCFDIDDTLIFDVSNVKNAKKMNPNHEVIRLMERLSELGVEIHLITARLNDPDFFEETKKELELYGIYHVSEKKPGPVYKSLTLAPNRVRTSMASISNWKMTVRKRIASESKSSITLTVGDQWGDMVVLKHENQIAEYDKEHAVVDSPFLILRPQDGVSLWGLKLPAR